MATISNPRAVIALCNGSAPIVTIADAPAPIGDNQPPALASDLLADVPALAYGVENAKSKFLAHLDAYFAAVPADDMEAATKDARHEIVIGLVAARLPVDEFPRKAMTIGERIAFALDLYDCKSAPSTAAAGTVPALRKGKTGWRTQVQHDTVRNAEKRASVYLAEVGAITALTDAERNAKSAARKGGGDPAPHHGKGKASDAPSHKQLVTPAKPLSAVEFAGQLLNMISTAMQYDNKHAAIRPIEYSAVADGLAALHKVALTCDAALHVRLSAEQAETPTKRKRPAKAA